VYDDVDEDKYQELVSKRREDNFIEDDGACALSQAVAARCRRRRRRHLSLT